MNWNSPGWKKAAREYQEQNPVPFSNRRTKAEDNPPESSRPAVEKWQLATVRLSDVEPQRTDWLWPGRLAAGKLTLFAGDPGLGKSQITIDIAARITTGAEWPDDGRAPLGNVIILSAEDGVADTLRPRFEAAAGNLERVRVVTTLTRKEGDRRSFTLQSDLALLGENVRAFGDVKLVVVDPITSYCGKVDGNSTTDIRAVLAPLSEFAEEHRLSLIAVSHPPKSAAGGKALYAVTGSLAWIAAARTAFTIVEDAEDTGRRLFLNSKNNIAPLAPGIGYRLVQRIVTGDCVASYVDWDNLPVSMSADQALAATVGDNETRTLKGEATEFLRDALAEGPKEAREVIKDAEFAGITAKSLRSAQKALGVNRAKEGFGGGWVWTLPKMPSRPEDALSRKRAPSAPAGIFGEPDPDRAPALGPPGDSLDDFK